VGGMKNLVTKCKTMKWKYIANNKREVKLMRVESVDGGCEKLKDVSFG
jgi:hypothetical protein